MSDFTAQIQLFIEQKPERSEDCQPVLQLYPDDSSGLLAVFDGAAERAALLIVWPTEAARSRERFWLRGSAEKTLTNFFDELKQQASQIISDSTINQLEERFKTIFKAETAKLQNGTGSKIKSSLIRNLPTTMAAIYFEKAVNIESENGFASWRNIGEFFSSEKRPAALKCGVLWAGDSRCYLLTPDFGLQQLTEDDLKTKGDALTNLIEDSPMSNFINADIDFVLNFRQFNADLPVVLIAATDGCFNFVVSPAHFEFLLLKTLQLAESAGEWQINLIEEIKKITGDDATMSLIALGWQDFSEIKRASTPASTRFKKHMSRRSNSWTQKSAGWPSAHNHKKKNSSGCAKNSGRITNKITSGFQLTGPATAKESKNNESGR